MRQIDARRLFKRQDTQRRGFQSNSNERATTQDSAQCGEQWLDNGRTLVCLGLCLDIRQIPPFATDVPTRPTSPALPCIASCCFLPTPQASGLGREIIDNSPQLWQASSDEDYMVPWCFKMGFSASIVKGTLVFWGNTASSPCFSSVRLVALHLFSQCVCCDGWCSPTNWV